MTVVTSDCMLIACNIAHAGLLGMGGGAIIGPLLLSLGTHPSVSAATSNTVLFFSSSFSALAFERMGLLNYQVTI